MILEHRYPLKKEQKRFVRQAKELHKKNDRNAALANPQDYFWVHSLIELAIIGLELPCNEGIGGYHKKEIKLPAVAPVSS